METQLAAARTRLILDKPFLGALVLRLPLEGTRSEWCETTFTDARTLYYNPDYIASLSLPETQFVLAREALHCALLHFARRGHRIRHRWNRACDYAVHPILLRDGLTAPSDALYNADYEEMTAEEIYPLLQDQDEEASREDENTEQTPEKSHRGSAAQPPAEEQTGEGQEASPRPEAEDGGEEQAQPQAADAGQTRAQAAEPPPLNTQERETLEVQWRQRMAGAAQQALQAGKLSDDLARLVDDLLAPRLPWRMLLAQHLTARARDDYSYTRPSSRRGEPAIMPSLRSDQVDMVVALDSSGSISEAEMSEFVSEVNAIKGQVRARVVLHACDAELSPDGPWVFEAWEPLELPGSFQGGGGTDFRPVFAWADTLDRTPNVLVYFTDAEGLFPSAPPPYPVIWLVKGRAAVPWGERIQLN
ncbi:MAG: hypothetical protein KGY40_06035 [Thioalkalivibrio sp.]|nr:hypothetical protein [Thioalkalivibrio sp.]